MVDSRVPTCPGTVTTSGHVARPGTLRRGRVVIVADHLDRASAAADALHARGYRVDKVDEIAAVGPTTTPGTIAVASADEVGADFWSSDWDVGLLALRVEMLGRRWAGSPEAQPPVLVTMDGALHLRGRAVALHGRPYQFASYLVHKALERLAAAGSGGLEVVTRDELARVVWQRRVVSPGAFDQAARAVRIALAPEGGRVKTVKGLGYWMRIM